MCSPACRFFICTQKALYYDRRTRTFRCRLFDDECLGGDCNYAKCAIGALMPDGRCRLALTRGKEEEEVDEEAMLEKFEKEFEEEDFE